MAIDLQTKLIRSIDFRDFENRANRLLNVLLNAENIYSIEFDKTIDKIEIHSKMVIIANEKNHKEDIVELTFLYQSPVKGYEDPSEDGWWGISTIRAARNAPFKYALSAALIAALSEIEGNPVIDQEMVYTTSQELQYEKFIEEFAAKQERSDTLD